MKQPQIPHISPHQPTFPNLTKDLNKYLKKQKTQDEISIVFFGTPEFSAYILEKLIEFTSNPPTLSHPRGVSAQEVNTLKFVVQAVVTSPDKPVGRKQEIKQSEVSLVAQKYNIPTLKPEELDQEFITSHLSLLASDLFLVVSFGKILPKALLDIPALGAINVHGSLLPKYRGASPIQSAILNGDEKTGITIMLMDEKLDHGPILSKSEVQISKSETTETLSNKMAQVGTKLLIATIQKLIKGGTQPLVQEEAIATYCNQIKKEDGYFDINNPPSLEKLDRMIRAYYPWPNVWTKWNSKIVKFYPEGYVQMEGKRKVKLEEFLRGYPEFPIKKLN